MPATFGGKIKPWELGVKSCWIAAGNFEGFQEFPLKKHAKSAWSLGWYHSSFIMISEFVGPGFGSFFFFVCVCERVMWREGSLWDFSVLLAVLLKRNGAFVLTLMQIKQIQSCLYLNMEKRGFFFKGPRPCWKLDSHHWLCIPQGFYWLFWCVQFRRMWIGKRGKILHI